MYTLYVDVSGMPTLDAEPSEPLVVLGLCVHERLRAGFERRLHDLACEHELPGAPIELHAKDFCCSISEQHRIPGFADLTRPDRRARVLEIRAGRRAAGPIANVETVRRRWRATDSFVHLTRIERTLLLQRALDVVGASQDVVLFADVWRKTDAFRNTGEREFLEPALTQVISRFDYYVDWQNLSRRPGEPREPARIVIDEDRRTEPTIRALFEGFIARGHPWGRLRAARERPVFRSSRKVLALQAADLCAYAVRRHVRRPDRLPERLDMERILPRFDRRDGALHGLRHYCRVGTCACLICVERGRAAP